MKIEYYWSKFLKKLRGSAVLNSKIHKTSKVEAGSEIINSSFGKHSFCGYNCEIINCEIGSFCSIANNVKIGGGMHPINWVSTSPVFYEGRDSVKAKFAVHKRDSPKKTIIGHDVWIGQGVFIKQGLIIGTGAVIGMGSTVTKDVEPYSIVAGCPARLIRKRFDDALICKLLKSEWWNYEDEKLHRYAQLFKEPNSFICKIGL
ncbi:MAG: CatB-related O-acetyltransferase [Bacteroidetes bacterium]|nr:CatB-related O-acetyltransferase [Bacteroidota bacterium]